MRKLSPKQRDLLLLLRSGHRIFRGKVTWSSMGSSGRVLYSYGEMVCPPGKESGPRADLRTLDGLRARGLLERVEQPPAPNFKDLGHLLSWSGTPRETLRLTEQGRSVEL